MALLGQEIVPFEIAGVQSGALSAGHRRLGAPEIAVTIEDYEKRLRDHYVILSAEERRAKDPKELAGVRVKMDPALLETLVYITEYPTPISGSFDAQFLELPEEVLVTVMRHHQKYFSVQDAQGKLAPKFVAVMNIDADPEGFVRSGNERVLRARFNDARFFWETDQKKKLADRVPDLAHVTFQAKLGSYLEKTERMMALAEELGGDARAIRGAELSKCDLTTELVKEFTELQGVVGGLYARVQGEPEPVWQAIYDHYKPESMEDSIPRNRTGQIVALADKLDTLRGCFRVGLIPTGSRDPFALRRAAQGVVKILVEGKFDLPLLDLIGGRRSLAIVSSKSACGSTSKTCAASSTTKSTPPWPWAGATWWIWRPVWCASRTFAPRPISSRSPPVSNASATSWNRPNSRATGEIDESLLEAGPGAGLYDEYRRIAGHPIETAISKLRPKVDLFFDKVLVNAPDARIRHNRLTLLNTLLKEFSTIADFSQIVTNF